MSYVWVRSLAFTWCDLLWRITSCVLDIVPSLARAHGHTVLLQTGDLLILKTTISNGAETVLNVTVSVFI